MGRFFIQPLIYKQMKELQFGPHITQKRRQSLNQESEKAKTGGAGRRMKIRSY